MRYEGAIYRPPSEAHSLILQVTVGCSHNDCTFCTMYKDKKFHIRKKEDIFRDLDEESAKYGNMPLRVFLADGDALVLPTEDLTDILSYITKKFPNVQRVTAYGSAMDVLRKTDEELTALREAGLEMIYMGAESGDDEALKSVHKNVSSAELIAAGKKLKKSGIAQSLTLISGLGGRARKQEHAVGSAKLISEVKPEYVGFLTLMLEESAPIWETISRGEMELLKPEEVLEEMRLFLQHVDSEGTVFRSNHPSNYFALKGTLNRDIPGMLQYLEEVAKRQKYRPEEFRAL